MSNSFIQYLEKLIRFKSITPYSNGCLEYIGEVLKKIGFIVEIKEFGDTNYKVSNLYATYGKERPNICFAGHIDVVPSGELNLWKTDPFIALREENKIYGRGAVDMKGAIACMLSATTDFLQNNTPSGQISFLLTSDEEGDAKYGTKMMLEYLKDQGVVIDLAIVGEPSNEEQIGDNIKIGRRGSINFSLRITGEQGHVAYPHRAQNPIPQLVRIMYDLNNMSLDEGSKFFQKSNLEITSIDVGNKVTNIIPEYVNALFNIRFNDQHTSKSLVNLIKEVIEKYTKNYSLDFHCSSDSFVQEPKGRIEDFSNIVKEALDIQPQFSTGGGTSDARFIRDYSAVVEFGLLSKMAHKINEYTEISDLQKLYNVYYHSLNKFLR